MNGQIVQVFIVVLMIHYFMKQVVQMLDMLDAMEVVAIHVVVVAVLVMKHLQLIVQHVQVSLLWLQ